MMDSFNSAAYTTMRKLGRGLLVAVLSFLLCTASSYILVLQFSQRNDRELEAAMTSFFFYGPVGAVVGFVVGLLC